MAVVTRRLAVVAAVAGAALAAAGAAAADSWQVHLAAADTAAARAVVLKRADLGGSGWTGGATKPDVSDPAPCASFHPKQSDLVLVGAAGSKWQSAGVEVDDSVHVLRTAKMVRLDWQRTVLAPAAMPCLRAGLKKELGARTTLVSFRRVAFPRLGFDSRAFRAVLDVKSGAQTIRVLLDEVVFGSGRYEVELTVVAPLTGSASVGAAEVRLARLLASRAR